MKNDLMEIAKRFSELQNDLLHGMYVGEDADLAIVDAVSDEILIELGDIERPDEVKKALMNMFFIGQLFT